MSRSRSLRLSAILLCAAALGVGACGSNSIDIAADDPNRRGAELFATHCGACHTLDIAGTEGSAVRVSTREYKDGPNFDERPVRVEDVLFAIQNGGFSSGPMPQQIVTGEDARRVAEFVARYAGEQAVRPPDPQGTNPDTPPGAQPPEESQ
jgi:mono/diheme cytochrome c family protein